MIPYNKNTDKTARNSETWEKEKEVIKKQYQPRKEKQIHNDTIQQKYFKIVSST